MMIAKRCIEVIAWAALTSAIGYFFLRDVPNYAIYTEYSYGIYWPNRGYLIPHVVGAGIAILVGLLQFSKKIRMKLPILHRLFGRLYVTGCVIGAPAAVKLAVDSECLTCRPALGSLAIYWLATTIIAFHFARLKSFATHRAFMIRSFVAMNVFVVDRIGYAIFRARIDDMGVRTMVEFVCVFVPLILTEAYFSWRPTIRDGNSFVRNRQTRNNKPI